MSDHTPDEYGMVVVDGVRYRPEDAPKPAAEDHPAEEPEKTPAKKAAPAAANKAKVPAAGGDAGESGTVPTK
ncbi:hypothetical protein [Nocardia neocaledoniensis]|uniref:hypothetical protein n=1 Tax=Nocardia neocaledoniensis TaxID=236511 RepID=UPI002454BBE9|nr:hypothetical protein [Nocardia neocaledoniensis]